MWNDDTRRRFDALRNEEARRALTDAERAELDALDAALDAEEARALAPAIERLEQEASDLRAEKAHVEDETQALERIVEQQEKLVAEARAYADRLRQRRAALTAELARVRQSHPHAR